MPNRIWQRESSSPTGYGGAGASSGFESKSSKGPSGGRSVKKLVRSLSDHYAAVTSPLTCKRKTSCSSRNPSIKTMKTTAATSLLPLKPAFSASCKSGTQSVVLASSRRKDSLTSASHVRTAPSMAISKRLLHVQALETPPSTVCTHIVKRPVGTEEGELTLRAPSSHTAPTLRLVNLSGNKKANSAAMQLMEMGIQRDLPVGSGASYHRQTHPLSQVLSRRTKEDWQQLEALLKLKDDEVHTISYYLL